METRVELHGSLSEPRDDQRTMMSSTTDPGTSETTDSPYVSPLTEIHLSVRRQHPLAATAAATLDRDSFFIADMQQEGGNALSGDPWEQYGAATWIDDPSSGRAWKPQPLRLAETTPEYLADPEHARSLLQTTPQLRFLCHASTDLQVAGYAGDGNILYRIIPALRESHYPNYTSVPPETSTMNEFKQRMERDHTNRRAAMELSSLLWLLAHEMTLEDYGIVETQVYSSIFSLMHANDNKELRMAGLSALRALLVAPSADEERKAIKFANTLSNGLRAAHGDYEFLAGVSHTLGLMASKTANVDLVESEITRALEWLGSQRSDRRLAACLALKELAIHAPTTFYSKTSQQTFGHGGSNEFLNNIFHAIHDTQPIVRSCAADALTQCLKIIVDRNHSSMTGLLCQVHQAMIGALGTASQSNRTRQQLLELESSQHGSLLVVSTMLTCAGGYMLPRYEEVCVAVLRLMKHKKALIRLECMRLLPRLASRCPKVFGRRYLEESLEFLIQSTSEPRKNGLGVDLRPTAYSALGNLVVAMVDKETGTVIGGSDEPTIVIVDNPFCSPDSTSDMVYNMRPHGIVYDLLSVIFARVSEGLVPSSSDSEKIDDAVQRHSLLCAANLVGALGDQAKPYIEELVDKMFQSGLSSDLIFCLRAISSRVPELRDQIEERLLEEVSLCLAGKERLCELQNVPVHNIQDYWSDTRQEGVQSLVLSLQTLASFGDAVRKANASGSAVPLTPFVKHVVSHYLGHKQSTVRRAAAVTCCALLLPNTGTSERVRITGFTGVVVDDVVDMLLRTAVSDPTELVRLCIVTSLDSRYDSFLCQRHHLPDLFLLLQDESLATRAAGLRLLGRLAALSPVSVLPLMRKFLNQLIVELRCDTLRGRGREDATRLLGVFLKAKPLHRLARPVLSSIIRSLSLDRATSPRLASATLEALGELAQAVGNELQPWVGGLIPRILEILQDQSSSSKQRTSLRTLGQIAGSTGYVVRPYIEYPTLLAQATDILPATKRAPWSLRREVMRTIGILGALDPVPYSAVATKALQGGTIGGTYFEETDTDDSDSAKGNSGQVVTRENQVSESAETGRVGGIGSVREENDENLPASLVMHEQYAMFAQPISELPPTKKMTPLDEDFYPTVAVQALMRIFRDPNLSAHHGMVIQAVMFIFKSMGLGCVRYLDKVVPCLLTTIKTCSSVNLRESMLKQLTGLSVLVREHLRPYVEEIFEVVETFWHTRHLAALLSLTSKIAVGIPDSFRRFVPLLVGRIVASFEGLESATPNTNSEGDTLERVSLLLTSTMGIQRVVSQYLHVLVPSLLKLVSFLTNGHHDSVSVEYVSILALRTLACLVESEQAISKVAPVVQSTLNFGILTTNSVYGKSLSSRVVLPLLHLFSDSRPLTAATGLVIVETLASCATVIGYDEWERLYHVVVRKAIVNWVGEDSNRLMCVHGYDSFIDAILHPDTTLQAVPILHQDYDTEVATGSVVTELDSQQVTPAGFPPTSIRHKANHRNLQRAWDVSQRSSRDDWDEWMRRFSIQLLREASAPALRSTVSLAHAYQPLARELFSAAFACCWAQLSDQYRDHLVQALETAFIADVSPEILQALLNLAEFMEHDSRGGLPIKITVLADLALRCQAYGKALHYREQEFAQGGGSNTIEALISINRKLGLQEAALGVLKASSLLAEARYQATLVGQELTGKTVEDFNMHYSVLATTAVSNDEDRMADFTAHEEAWLAKLGSWAEALEVYKGKLQTNPQDLEAILGCMRCLGANGEWRKVLSLAEVNLTEPSSKEMQQLSSVQMGYRRKATKICAQAAWKLGRWDDLEKFAGLLLPQSSSSLAQKKSAAQNANSFEFDRAYFSAVLSIHRKKWKEAAIAIDNARRALDQRLTAFMAESYTRAYPSMVTAQTLAEMEEIISFRQLEERAQRYSSNHSANRADTVAAKKHLVSVWRDRLAGCRLDSEVHSSILTVRTLVLGPEEEVEATLRLSDLSRQEQRFKYAERVLLDALGSLKADIDGPVFGFGMPNLLRASRDLQGIHGKKVTILIPRVVEGSLIGLVSDCTSDHKQYANMLVDSIGGLRRITIHHRLYFAYVKHLWFTDRKEEATSRLLHLCDSVDMIDQTHDSTEYSKLRVACWIKLGEWQLDQRSSAGEVSLPESFQLEILKTFKRAIILPESGYKAWHKWALLNLRLAQNRHTENGATGKGSPSRATKVHVEAAVKGFVSAICVGTRKWSASVQQDLLNLLSCLFRFGNSRDVAAVIGDNIGSIAIEAWLGVLPQLLARIHIRDSSIRSVLHPLLIRLGEKHPQAMMYPLSVLLNSPVAERKASAESLMNSLKGHSSALVDEAQMVSSELIRVAILWLETWNGGIETASQLYFEKKNKSAMLDVLLPLHEMLDKGAETGQEDEFLAAYGQDLAEAHRYIREYTDILERRGKDPIEAGQLRREEDLIRKAWGIYYTVFRTINGQLPAQTTLELSQCSPALRDARGLELGVPGTYRVDGSYVKIERFSPSVGVIASKQRPRKVTMHGSDGKNYLFLLKGHEDLRQDERVMQLFGLVNALLVRDPQTKKHDLRILRYTISALSHNCGIVGWVPQADTFHTLIKEYREEKKIPLNMENREMLRIAPNYDILTVIQKVEVFTEALRKSTGHGNDLYEILWLKSKSSEEWVQRRTRYTRSLAVMSMVGHILGLGDRHPSNLMLDKISGRVLHIDFGDCFEVAMKRDRFPEKVPFRLTRMLIKAMEVCGIEGSYRGTCERTMSVLRGSRDSLVTMLEAFVYDPLISWRLVDPSESRIVSHTPAVDKDGVPVSVPDELGDPDLAARDRHMYTNIQNLAADLAADSRIASITGADNSVAQSRLDKSMRQRESMSVIHTDGDGTQGQALNTKALQVIRRVQDKLAGTDFPDRSELPLDVSDQVQRLIVQATSSENLCQLFIGWCSFW